MAAKKKKRQPKRPSRRKPKPKKEKTPSEFYTDIFAKLTSDELHFLIDRTWVNVVEDERLYSGKKGHPDRPKYPRHAVALMPSRARHLGKATDWALKEIRHAFDTYGEGTEGFAKKVQRVSTLLDIPLVEIYTLWFSP